MASASAAATTVMAASARPRRRGAPLPTPLSATRFTPAPRARTHPARAQRAAAVPRQRIRRGYAGGEALAPLLEHRVSRAVPERIVHLLEIVQIDEHRCHLAVAALREVHYLLEAVIEQAPVGQSGERIVIGEEAH